jgi:hypothetical protein
MLQLGSLWDFRDQIDVINPFRLTPFFVIEKVSSLVLWIRIRMDPHQFGKPHLDPHHSGKPDTDPNLSKKQRVEEAHNGDLESLWAMVADLHHFDEEKAGSGAASK